MKVRAHLGRFAPDKLSRPGRHAAVTGFAIELTDERWERVADLFDPPGRRGAPAQIARRQMVNAMLRARPKGQTGFTPIAPLHKIEHTFAQLGRWRRLSRCCCV
jgi:hypothetical protein